MPWQPLPIPPQPTPIHHIDVAKLVPEPPKPDFDREVLAPLKAAQAKAEAERKAAEEAARKEMERVRAAESALAASVAKESAPTPEARFTAPQPVSRAVAGDIPATITRWANHYGVSADWLLRVATCESTLNPAAVNRGYYAGGGHPSGLFQFLPQTFYANAARAGIAGADLWSVEHQAQTAAYMFSIGQHVQWECR